MIGERPLHQPREHRFGHAKLGEAFGNTQLAIEPVEFVSEIRALRKSHRGLETIEPVADMLRVEANDGWHQDRVERPMMQLQIQ